MRIGLVVPHIFMQDDILRDVIFSPGELALLLADGLTHAGIEVTLYTPGRVTTTADNITSDLTLFQRELDLRGDSYTDLLKKHPGTFIALARQVQAELLARAFTDANDDKLDIVHVWTNEEDIALPFTALCRKPVAFTHHDPFNFTVKYKNNFPKYKHLNWVALSESQKTGMPPDTNWLATIYHGLPIDKYLPLESPTNDYVAYLGRIVEPKGVHLAIAAIKAHNQQFPAKKLQLRIAGKHYHGHKKDTYWQAHILPELDESIVYTGYLDTITAKQQFLGNARALIIPSVFDEPFGMVMIEAMACGTPTIGLANGAIPEVIDHHVSGILAKNQSQLVDALDTIAIIDRAACRRQFEQRFTLDRMCDDYRQVYRQLHANRG